MNMQMRFFEIVAFYLPRGGSIRGFFLGGMDTYEHMLHQEKKRVFCFTIICTTFVVQIIVKQNTLFFA